MDRDWEDACGTNPLLTFILTSMYVFFLTRPRVLEPHLRHTLAETGHRGDPLQILAIRITVNLEVGLQHLQLLLGEGGAHPFRLALVITIAITALWNGKNKNRNQIRGRSEMQLPLDLKYLRSCPR